MTYILPEDIGIARGQGLRTGEEAVHKFGRNPDVDSGALEDLWDGGGIWAPPTAARIHQFASTSTDDAAAGTGLRTCRAYGLSAWNAAPVSEIITMNGQTDVAATTAVVAYHRIQPLTWGSAGPNVGTITATADTDATVTAQIAAGVGQTRMAIYCIPENYTFFLRTISAGLDKASAASSQADVLMMWNPIPDSQLDGFVQLEIHKVMSDGSGVERSYQDWPFPGPGILKLCADASANNLDIKGNFHGILAAD